MIGSLALGSTLLLEACTKEKESTKTATTTVTTTNYVDRFVALTTEAVRHA
jgi:hypothetical protein